MANYIGGSAPAMAAQVADGFILVSAQTLKSFLPSELGLLKQELDKLLRAVRAETVPQADPLASQVRNRRLSRISSAMQVISNQMMQR